MLVLSSCPLFKSLSQGELERLRAVADVRPAAAGEVIFKEGDVGDGLYVVAEGRVQISVLIGETEPQVLFQMGPGEVFGEMAVLESKPRSAAAIAKTEAVVYFLPRGVMVEMLEASPQISLALVRVISNRLREANRQYIREVLQTERLALVGRFARSIVHDLKNPLHIIGLTAELIGMPECRPESRREGQARIGKQVDRISEMVNEILEFTQGANTAFVPAPMSYRLFLQNLLEEMSPELALRSCRIEMPEPPPEVRMMLVPKRLRRVFYNLFHNATDAMPQGGDIQLRFRREGDFLITEIEDAGSGIPPEMSAELFAAFATFGKAHGTGLGLSIAKKIVKDHGGTIGARNLPGRGALFYFALPIQPPA